MEHESYNRAVIDAAQEVCRELGRGYLKAVYHAALAVELEGRGVPFKAEQPLPVRYRDSVLPTLLVTSLICFESLLVETTAFARLTPAHETGFSKQLRATKLSSGLLLNFGESFQPVAVAGFEGDIRLREESVEDYPQITEGNADCRKETGDVRTYQIIGAAMAVHRELGHFFSEEVYKHALAVELERKGVPFRLEVPIPILYKGTPLPCSYRADLICFDEIIVELKAVDLLLPVHQAQLLNELHATRHQLGLLLNFGAPSLQQRRIIKSLSPNLRSPL